MSKGVYVLVISVQDDINVNVGALGSLEFLKGLYIYVGSAQNNVEKRVTRHLRKNKRRFWHVDYLLGSEPVKVIKTISNPAGRSAECRIAGLLSERGMPVKGFGCSDCDCDSHLFCVDDYRSLEGLITQVSSRSSSVIVSECQPFMPNEVSPRGPRKGDCCRVSGYLIRCWIRVAF